MHSSLPTTSSASPSNKASSDSNRDRLVPGHALVMQPEKGFQGLASFGNNFLSKFEGVEVDADILRNITIIDTPGVLSGEKQRIGRDYNYAEVVKWFAERADMIIVMFDAHKLDISDELKGVLDILKPHHEKIRILLNKVIFHLLFSCFNVQDSIMKIFSHNVFQSTTGRQCKCAVFVACIWSLDVVTWKGQGICHSIFLTLLS